MNALRPILESRVSTVMCAVLMASLVGFTALAKSSAPVAGKVSFLKGNAERAQNPDGPWQRLKKNKKVFVGEYIRTQADSRLELQYADKSVVRLAADSVLFVEDTSVDVKKQKRQVTASLVAGKAWAKVSSVVGSDSKFEVKTENAVAGVRGTTFRINALADASTLVKVYTGAVAVSNAPYFQKTKTPEEVQTPIDFKGRKPVAAPFQEVSKKEWEQLCGEWMAVKISADGTMEPAFKFAKEDDIAEDGDWVAWNVERDG